MSGIIGHSAYAILAGKAAQQRKLPVAPIIGRHYASYLAGAYLGSDVQTLPAAICVDTGQKVGYCAARIDKSPITGGAIRPWRLRFDGAVYTPRQLYEMFYGRAHLVFGWTKKEKKNALPWDHLADYLAFAVGDAIELFGPGERHLAYMFGWMVHVVSDSLIKSVRPGITLHLLDGKYTPQNRPIQDLVTFHEIGKKELGLNWRNLLADLVATPVEPVQAHYMRVAKPRGQLAEHFPALWVPENEKLLLAVLAENRHYQRIRNQRILEKLELIRTDKGWQCDQELARITGGLSYQQMVELADKANFRRALGQMTEAIADVFEQVVARQPLLKKLPLTNGPTWKELAEKWGK